MLGISFFFSLKMLCDNISAFQMETNRGFIVIMILIRFVPSLFYHCQMKLLFTAEKTPLVSAITLYIKAIINMEDKCPLNLNKFHS